MNGRRRAWVHGITVASTCLALALPTAASAETFRHRDPAHDVVRVSEASPTPVPVPANRSADITRVRFSHTRRHVATLTTVRHYAGGSWTLTEVIRTPSARYVLWGTMLRGDLSFQIARGSGHSHACRGITGTVRPGRDQILVSVPTRCVQGPRWVRVGLYYTVMSRDGTLGYVDNALRPGGGMQQTPDLGPRLRRG